jgi:hypothetical protein
MKKRIVIKTLDGTKKRVLCKTKFSYLDEVFQAVYSLLLVNPAAP